MKSNTKKILFGAGAAIVVVGACFALTRDRQMDFHNKYEGTDLVADVAGMDREGTYTQYLN